MAVRRHKTKNRDAGPRRNRLCVLLNDREQRALEGYCRRYRVTNRSALVRRVLIESILRRLNADAPTLFD